MNNEIKFFNVFFQQLLVLDPYKRISAKNAMQHAYFSNTEKVSYVALPLDTP